MFLLGVGSGGHSEESSAILLCDDHKIWVNYYSLCSDCKCNMEQYVYKDYGEDECWDVSCNAVAISGYHHLVSSQLKLFGAHSGPNSKIPDRSENAAEIVVDSFVSMQAPFTLDDLVVPNDNVKTVEHRQGVVRRDTVTNSALFRKEDLTKLGIPTFTSEVSSWIYVLGLGIFVIFCGVCRYNNSFDPHYYEIVHAKHTDFAEEEHSIEHGLKMDVNARPMQRDRICL